MKYKVICSDLDGTLLDSDSELSRENFEAIRELSKKGIRFVPSTGRTVGEIPDSVLKGGFAEYVIYSNGAGIFDLKSGKSFDVQRMTPEVRSRIFDVILDFDVFVIMHSDMKMYIDSAMIREHEKFHFSSAYYKLFEYSANIVEDIVDFGKTALDVESLVIAFTSSSERDKCVERLSKISEIVITSSGFGSIEIMMKSAGKGKALSRLAKRLDMSETEFIAAGDSMNDEEMILAAGLGLATSNADERVKAAADAVICSNNEHIAKYILENII